METVDASDIKLPVPMGGHSSAKPEKEDKLARDFRDQMARMLAQGVKKSLKVVDEDTNVKKQKVKAGIMLGDSSSDEEDDRGRVQSIGLFDQLELPEMSKPIMRKPGRSVRVASPEP